MTSDKGSVVTGATISNQHISSLIQSVITSSICFKYKKSIHTSKFVYLYFDYTVRIYSYQTINAPFEYSLMTVSTHIEKKVNTQKKKLEKKI